MESNSTELSEVFDITQEEKCKKFRIKNFNSIQKILNLLKITEDNQNASKIIDILKNLKEAFFTFRVIIIYFNEYAEKHLYEILIDFYLSNTYNSSEIDTLCIEVIDLLVNNLDISKSIIDHIISKYSKYFYSIEKNIPQYLDLKKLLNITNHLYGVNLNYKKPKNYYYFCGNEQNKDTIKIPLNVIYSSLGISLWFKSYQNFEGEILSFMGKKKLFSINISSEKINLVFGEENTSISKESYYLNEWNLISFYYKSNKKGYKLTLYINDKQVLNDFSFNLEGKNEKEELTANNISLGNNFYGEMTSIILTNNPISFVEYKKLLLNFPFGLISEKDLIDFNTDFKKIMSIIECIYVPYGGKYNLYNNRINSLIFTKNSNVNIFRCFQKKINLLGGINIILPIIEILYVNMKLCIENKDLLYSFFDLILTILKYKKKNQENAIENYFFMVLSIFIEKMPEELFNDKIHEIIVDLAKNIFSYHKTCSLYLDYCNYVLLNEKIVFKFSAPEQVQLLEQIYDYYNKSEDLKLPLNKLISIINCNDNKYLNNEEMCCKKHYDCFLDDYKPVRGNIMQPDFNTKTKNLFLLFESILNSSDNKKEDFKQMLNMLCYKNSPCLTGKILQFLNENLSKVEKDKKKEKENKKTKDILFSFFTLKDYKIILFHLLSSEFLDIKYDVINLIFMLYNYNKKKFDFSIKVIKDNIFPKNHKFNFDYTKFSPSDVDTNFLAEHCVNKIQKNSVINCFKHDNIICSTAFNFAYFTEYYTKFINLFTNFLNDTPEKNDEILDLLIYMCKNLNIEATLSFYAQINYLYETNNNLSKRIFSFIPLINYLLDTLVYYSEFQNSIFVSTFSFLINMITNLKDNDNKIFIIEYVMKYFSLLKNNSTVDCSQNLNDIINKILSKFINKITELYINTETYEKSNEFVITLTSYLFDYIAIFNQDKTLYKVYKENTKNDYILSSYTGVSIVCAFIKGLNMKKIDANLNKPKLEELWCEYGLVSKILTLFMKYLNISDFFGKDNVILTQLDKVLFIYDNLIYRHDNIDETLFNKKKELLYYVKDEKKNIPLIQIIAYLFMLSLNICKEINEYKKLFKDFIEYIEFIIVSSTRVFSSISQAEQQKEDNKKSLNQGTITFCLMYLFDVINQPNEFIKKNISLKDILIKGFNELLSICLFIYIQRIPPKKEGLFKGMYIKMKSKIYKQQPLSATPPYEIIHNFLISDENQESENQNIQIIKNNEKNFLNFYLLLTGSEKMMKNFYVKCEKYISKNFASYINFDIIINLPKMRLEENTMEENYTYPSTEKYDINFENINSEIINIIENVKKTSSDYTNYSYQTQRYKRNTYKSLKKELFIWNGAWSNKELFYKDQKRLKYKLYNHLTKSLLRPFLVPLLDLEYYTPNFTRFNIENLFNKNDLQVLKYKYPCLDIDKILNTFKKKTEDYEYRDISDKEEQTKSKKFECCFVKPTHHIKGIFLLYEDGITFNVYLNQKTMTNDINDTDTSLQEKDIDYDNIRHTCYGSCFVSRSKDKDNLYFNFSFDEIEYVFKRIYYYHQTGLEIFSTNNKTYYFNFKNATTRNKIYDIIKSKINSKKYNINADNIITKWKKYEISNMELIMWLNVLGGRSYNDLSQYPVIPWVLINNNKEKLQETDLKEDKNLYRDLSLPLGMITLNDNGERKNSYIFNLKTTTIDYEKKINNKNENTSEDLYEKPYNYGSHYSNPFYVSHYLTRIFPFAYIMIELQGDKFDDPDRMFINFDNSFICATTQKGDVRELIPEIYCLPEIYYNINNFDMGIKRDKEKVNDVLCPLWTQNNPYKLITFLNLAFESDEVSFNINNWIDLIFGYKQRGKEAEKANNVYIFNSYPDLVDIENLDEEKKIYYYRFVEFGSCPRQLFTKQFQKREKLSNFKQIIDKDVNVITIELKSKNSNSENLVQQMIEMHKIIKMFPTPKKSAKFLYSDFTGIELIQNKINENTYQYEQNIIIYGYGIKYEKYLLGNNRINDNPPAAMYNKGKFLIEGGYINGSMMITDFENMTAEILYNPNDKSPVTSILINKDENMGIVSNNIGIIYIYNISGKKWEYINKVHYHSKKINYLFISDELNAFASCSEDNFVNIYGLPSCNLIHSFEIEEPELVLLSARPLPVCLIYSKKLKKLNIYGVNGNLICGIDVDEKPQYPFIYTSRYYRDYLIYSKKGTVFIHTFPYLEIFNTIKIPGDDSVNRELYLEYQQHKNGEELYVLEKDKQILYIIGDQSVNE